MYIHTHVYVYILYIYIYIYICRQVDKSKVESRAPTLRQTLCLPLPQPSRECQVTGKGGVSR